MPRLNAEADHQYKQNDPMLPYVKNSYAVIEEFIEEVTLLLDDLEDDRVYFGITGCQSLNEMKRRHDRLGERIKVAEQTGNVVSFLKYKRTEPKGAA